eukprot:949908_1
MTQIFESHNMHSQLHLAAFLDDLCITESKQWCFGSVLLTKNGCFCVHHLCITNDAATFALDCVFIESPTDESHPSPTESDSQRNQEQIPLTATPTTAVLMNFLSFGLLQMVLDVILSLTNS